MINGFLQKAWQTSQAGATVVILVHTCTDTAYWNDWVWDKAAEVRHIKGRLRFWLGNEGNTSDLPHSLLIYRPYYFGSTHQISWDWKKAYMHRFGLMPIRGKETRQIKYYENPTTGVRVKATDVEPLRAHKANHPEAKAGA